MAEDSSRVKRKELPRPANWESEAADDDCYDAQPRITVTSRLLYKILYVRNIVFQKLFMC